MGAAVQIAAQKLKEKVLQNTAASLNVGVDELIIDDNGISIAGRPDTCLTYAHIYQSGTEWFASSGPLVETGSSLITVARYIEANALSPRSKGLGEPAVISRHVFRNSLIPVVTLAGPVLVELIAGSFVIEAMFGFPGFGREYWEALVNLDYGMIAGVTLLYAGLIVFVNLLVEMLYGVIDPRVRGN